MTQKQQDRPSTDGINYATITDYSSKKTLADRCRIRHAEVTNSTLRLELGKNSDYGYVPPNPDPLADVNLRDVTLVKMINHSKQTETTPMKVFSIGDLEGDCLFVVTDEQNPEMKYNRDTTP